MLRLRDSITCISDERLLTALNKLAMRTNMSYQDLVKLVVAIGISRLALYIDLKEGSAGRTRAEIVEKLIDKNIKAKIDEVDREIMRRILGGAMIRNIKMRVQKVLAISYFKMLKKKKIDFSKLSEEIAEEIKKELALL